MFKARKKQTIGRSSMLLMKQSVKSYTIWCKEVGVKKYKKVCWSKEEVFFSCQVSITQTKMEKGQYTLWISHCYK